MNIDYSFVNLPFNLAFKGIVDTTKSTLKPIVIIRDDSTDIVSQIRHHFPDDCHFIFLRLGVTCRISSLFKELMFLVAKRKVIGNIPWHATLQQIASGVKNAYKPHYFVIDGCHFIRPRYLPLFLGLIIDLDRRAQFILSFTKENFERIQHSRYAQDRRFTFFCDQITWFAIWRHE